MKKLKALKYYILASWYGNVAIGYQKLLEIEVSRLKKKKIVMDSLYDKSYEYFDKHTEMTNLCIKTLES